jgi:serine/threonine protein kinase
MGCFSSKESSEGSKYEVSKSGPSTKENTGHASGGGASSNDKGKKPPTFGFETTHTIIKFLGEGAEGETWLAKDKETGKNVAIKLLKRPIRDMDFGVMEREVGNPLTQPIHRH